MTNVARQFLLNKEKNDLEKRYIKFLNDLNNIFMHGDDYSFLIHSFTFRGDEPEDYFVKRLKKDGFFVYNSYCFNKNNQTEYLISLIELDEKHSYKTKRIIPDYLCLTIFDNSDSVFDNDDSEEDTIPFRMKWIQKKLNLD